MRPGGGGFNKEKGIKALAWISFAFAVIGGAAVAGTFLGDWVSGFVGWFPSWVGALALVAAIVALGIDLFVDGIPNQIALYMAMGIPSLGRSVPGKLGDNVTQLSHQALDATTNALGVWLGVSSAVGLAAVCAAVSLLMARRVISKGR